jgi:hypothetical protein
MNKVNTQGSTQVEIERLQARIEAERNFTFKYEQLYAQGQAKIAELETTIAGYKKHFNEPTERDSRMTWQDKYKQAQARIAELEEMIIVYHEMEDNIAFDTMPPNFIESQRVGWRLLTPERVALLLARGQGNE